MRLNVAPHPLAGPASLAARAAPPPASHALS